MFDEQRVSVLSVPRWERVFRAELIPGVVSIVAIHDTTRGRALGGCRMQEYDNEALALTDVLRLSRGMTFKNAIADLPLGGGKSVIIADPKISGDERNRVLTEFGKFIAWVNKDSQRYCTAEDMNTTVADMHVVKQATDHIFGTEIDPSPYTAWGVFSSMRFAVSYFADDLFDSNSVLKGKKVLIQGLGKVGTTLADYLHEVGAKLYVTDIREESINRLTSKYGDAEVVNPNDIMNVDVDIFAPCAGGEVITPQNVDNLRFKILAGAANNQLSNTKTGIRMHQNGVVYCPDYITNMGGVCSIQYIEIERLSDMETRSRIQGTVDRQLTVTFQTGFRENISFNNAVDLAVKEIIWGVKPTLEGDGRALFPEAGKR